MAGVLMLVAVVVALVEHGLGAALLTPRWPPAKALLTLHSICCLWAATGTGAFVLQREVRDETFWAIQLLPLPARQVFWLKLWLPLYCIALAWIAAIPIYFMALLLDLSTTTGAAYYVGIAAWVGGLGLPLALLGSGMVQPVSPTGPKPADKTAEALRGLSGLALWGAGVAVWFNLASAPDRFPFYGLRISAWPAAGALLGVAWAAAAAHGVNALRGTDRYDPRLRWILGAPLVCVAIGATGALWGRVPAWVGVAAAAVVVVALIASHHQSQQKSGSAVRKPDDSWSAAEIAWIAARSESPMLIRDLRASTRVRSLRRAWLHQVWITPLLIGFLYLVVVQFRLGFGPVAWIVIGPLVSGLGNLATANWGKDRGNGTLTMLKLCPLTSRQLLRERLVASFLCEAPAAATSLVLVLGILGWLLYRGFWITGPLAVAFLPLLAVTSTWSACNASTANSVCSRSYRIARAVISVAIPCGAVTLILLRDHGPLLQYGIAAPLGVLYGCFATFVFREYAQRFETSRTVDSEPTSE